MAFDKYKNGAWMEPESGVRKYEASAWVDCDFARRYKSNAWEDVWTNAKVLPMISRTTKTGCFYANEHWDGDCWFMAVDDAGYVLLAIDGTFTNPTISFVYEGGLSYTLADGTIRYLAAGYVRAYGITSGGSVNESNYVNVGSASGSSDYEYAEFTLSGTYQRIGIKIQARNWNVSPDPQGFACPATIFVGQITLDGQRYIADSMDNYDYDDYY